MPYITTNFQNSIKIMLNSTNGLTILDNFQIDYTLPKFQRPKVEKSANGNNVITTESSSFSQSDDSTPNINNFTRFRQSSLANEISNSGNNRTANIISELEQLFYARENSLLDRMRYWLATVFIFKLKKQLAPRKDDPLVLEQFFQDVKGSVKELEIEDESHFLYLDLTSALSQ